MGCFIYLYGEAVIVNQTVSFPLFFLFSYPSMTTTNSLSLGLWGGLPWPPSWTVLRFWVVSAELKINVRTIRIVPEIGFLIFDDVSLRIQGRRKIHPPMDG